ncbi:ubiquitin carboxyl-terminal hydrolase 37-like [Mugil cephalus]|uniref:ubiquitin carboxyl-terminal hydrolase 37-like n=1 Tax=Mugil cephalus TaxID=48193 RepID=UPI001FB62431|nr:ubiquitin carboxyl-terminal hydrolase 37-like [Mugil cephalus]
MEPVWSSVPGAQLLRQLIQLQEKHASTASKDKRRLLRLFKDTVSGQAMEFRDDEQKDAHEFLTSVLDQIQGLCPLLKEAAAGSGTTYTCPVEENLVFWMENTRTCQTCGAQNTRREKFTNISLDVIPGGTTEEMLEAYQEEEAFEFTCQCGGRISTLKSTLDTLPGVLIMHLKRFRFTPTFTLEKVDDPVQVQRDMVVSSNQGGGCYSLVSTINHFGTAQGGHYIADALHPDDCPYEPTDRWLTLNDSKVTETVGSSVCKERKESAYVLFYKRHV